MAEDQTGDRSDIEKVMAEGVECEIGGVKHRLKFSLWSYCKLDELLGKNPFIGASWAEAGPKDLLGLLWAGLLHEKDAMSVEELGKAISMADLNRLTPLIQQAMGQSAPAPDEEKKTPSA